MYPSVLSLMGGWFVKLFSLRSTKLARNRLGFKGGGSTLWCVLVQLGATVGGALELHCPALPE